MSKADTAENTTLQNTHSDDGRMVVGISLPSDHIDRWRRDGTYLQRQFEKRGFEVQLAYAHDLIDVQMKDIESMLEKGADALVIAPVDSSALTDVLKEAQSIDVPIISYDRLLMKTFAVDYYVSFDNVKAGRMQGEFVENALDLKHAKGKSYHIEFASGDVVDYNAWCFYSGMYEVLEPYLETGVLSMLSGQKDFYETATPTWSSELSEDRFLGLLSSFYIGEDDLDAVVCANDSIARGVLRAIKEEYNKDNSIVITGQDADEQNIRDIIDGRQSMTVYRSLECEAIVTENLVEAILQGDPTGEELIQSAEWDFPCRYDESSYDNGKKTVPSYLMEPVIITKDNIQTELVDTGFYKMGADGYPTLAE